MKYRHVTDTCNVGIIVPLPNHYNSDMPQGHGAVRNAIFGQLFFLGAFKEGSLLKRQHSCYNAGMAEKQTDKQTDIGDQVKLPNILGIKPGVYLTALYSIILTAILFFLLFLPGLTKPGAVLVVKTTPAGAAIRVDGAYMGTSHSKIPLRKGTHVIEAVLPGFEPQSATHNIPGRVFGARFFPLRYNAEYVLKTGDPAAAFALAAADYAAWSFGGEPTATWQIPLSLSEGAYRAGSGNGDETAEILKAASRFATTRAALRDLIRAKTLVDNGGNSPSPVSLADSISDILAFLSENQGSAGWLAGLLPPESASIVKESDWYKALLTTDTEDKPSTSPIIARGRLRLDGLSFASLPDGYLISEQMRVMDIKSFMISETTVPDSDISWYEAEAYCQKLTEQLPASMAGMVVRLPTELELEYAVKCGIINNLEADWEWCADPYAPLDFITASPEAIKAIGSPEHSLRKGTARSSLPPHLSSPFVSFRPVIAPKE
jgi:hypothetical protein